MNDVIELNGKRYHARTGAFLGDQPDYQPASKPTGTPAAHHGPRHIHQAATAAKPATKHTARPTPTQAAIRKTQPARTLMRRAVAKPQAAIAKPHIKPQAPVQTAVVTQSPIKPKLTASNIDRQRSHRATAIDRSRLVKHFQSGEFVTHAPARSLAPVAPKAMTVQQTAKPIAKPAAAAIHHTDLTAAKPVYNAPQRNAAGSNRPQHLRTSLRRPAAATTAAQPNKQPAAPTAAIAHNDDNEQDIFERALAMATSHQEQPPKQSMLKAAKRRKRARRLTSLAAGFAVFALLVGFIAYQNKASIQMQLASAKAGFAASTPVYKPEGYAMGKVAYEPGTVTAMYNKAAKSFTIVQKQSNWDSQTLLENFVATSNEDYQGYESNGRTIYLYGNGKATWVDGGIWYQINAGNVLPTDQLVKVAASM